MKKILTGTISLILISLFIIAFGTGILGKLMRITEDKVQGTEIMEKNAAGEGGNSGSDDNDSEGGMEEGIEEDITEQDIDWNGYQVKVYEYGTKYEEGFLSYEEAISIAVEHINIAHANAISTLAGREISNPSNTNTFANEDILNPQYINAFVNEDISDVHIEVVLMTSELGEYLSRAVYEVYFSYENYSEEEKTKYWEESAGVCIDAITAETYSLYSYKQGRTDEDCIKNDVMIDGYTEQQLGYGGYEGLDDEEISEHFYEKLNSVKAEYENIARKFIEDNMNIGEVTESYNYVVRAFRREGEYNMAFCCRVSDGETILIEIDQIEKTIVRYQRNPSDVDLQALNFS